MDITFSQKQKKENDSSIEYDTDKLESDFVLHYKGSKVAQIEEKQNTEIDKFTHKNGEVRRESEKYREAKKLSDVMQGKYFNPEEMKMIT